MEKIYIDSLFLLNFIMSYLIISLTAHFAAKGTKQWRMVVAAFLGAISSFYILAPVDYFWLHITVKIVSAIVITLSAFSFTGLRRFIRIFGLYFGFTFLFGGMFLLLAELLPENMQQLHNGIIYIDFSPIVFLLSAGIFYLLISIFKRIAGGKLNKGIVTVEIKIGNRNMECRVLLDNGHSLRDLFTDLPVIVLSINGSIPLISDAERKAIIFKDHAAVLRAGYRLVPCKTVAATGLLPVKKADFACLRVNSVKEIEFNACVGFTEQKLSDDFIGIINPCVFNEV